MNLELYATPKEVMRAVEALREFGRDNRLQEKVLFALELTLEECGSNIVNHSLRSKPGLTFHVSVQLTGNAVVIELRDRGPEFDPTKSPAIQRKVDLENQPPGGWGLVLVRRYMDEVQYVRQNGQNILTLTKRLAGTEGWT